MGTLIALLIGIAALTPVVIHSTRNLKRAMKRDKELYLKSSKNRKP